MSKIYLEFIDAKSSKFWQVEWNDEEYTVTYGKIGAKGTSKTTECEDPKSEARKQANAKIKKGYVEVKRDVKPSVDEIEGAISVWFTNLPEDKDIGTYCEFNYSDKDEDGLSQSQFTKDFNIGWYDEDFAEIHEIDEPTNDYESLFEGGEYEDIIMENYDKLTKHLNGQKFTGIIMVGEVYCENVKAKNDDGTVFFAGSINPDEDYDDEDDYEETPKLTPFEELMNNKSLGASSLLKEVIKCLNGEGVTTNEAEILQMIERSRKGGLPFVYSNVGYAYQYGTDLKKDAKKAIEYYSKGVEFNDYYSIHNLGICYLNGEGVDKDLDKAMEYFHAAMEYNYSNAYNSAGSVYADDKTKFYDTKKAFEHFEKAYEGKVSHAANNLAVYYKRDIYVAQDYNKALSYYKKAVEWGHPSAQKSHDELLDFMKKEGLCIKEVKLELKDGNTHKFWTLTFKDLDAKEYTIHSGDYNTDGSKETIKVENDLRRELMKLVKSKLNEGYTRVNKEIVSTYTYNLKETRKGLNPMYKLCAIFFDDNDYYQFEKRNGIKRYKYHDGGGNEYELLIKGDKAVLRDFDHENIFSQEANYSALVFDFGHLVYDGADGELLKELDTTYLTYGMWTNGDNQWYTNKLFENDFKEKYFKEKEYRLSMFEDLDRELMEEILEDNFEIELPKKVLDIVCKDKPITKQEVIKIIELLEEEDGDGYDELDIISLDKVDEIVELLSGMYEDDSNNVNTSNNTNDSNSVYLEFKDDKSSKFWKVEWNEDSYTVTYGKIGANGTTKTTECDDPQKEARKQADSKIKKGYVKVNGEQTDEEIEPYVEHRDDCVSIWFENMEEVGDYFVFEYPDEDDDDYDEDEDDFSSSQFTREFGLEWYDEDFSDGAQVSEPTNDYKKLVSDTYNAKYILPKIDEITKHLNGEKFTGVIIVPDMYCENIRPRSKDGKVVFVGSVDYSEERKSTLEYYLDDCSNKNEIYNKVIDCLNGKGFTTDENDLFKMLERSNKLGYHYVYSFIGVALHYGKNVPVNEKMAVKAYLKGIDKKDEYCMHNLGICYREGEGVEVDLEKAEKYFKMGMDHGHLGAINNLGCIYNNHKEYKGYDPQKAFELFNLGASKGDGLAACNVGEMYEDGDGREVDLEQALIFYKKAEQLGYSNAKDRYNKLYDKLNPKKEEVKEVKDTSNSSNNSSDSNEIYLEFIDDKSSKFYQVTWDESSYTITYGKIGAKGTTKTTECSNPEVEARKQANSKIKKGYKEAVNQSNDVGGCIEIKLVDNDELDIKDSKFGGLPFIPRGFELPKSRMNDGPLFLLAQFNLSQLPKGVFPIEKGFLQFYIEGEDDMYGIEYGDPVDFRGYKVVYHKDTDDYYDEDELEDIYTPNDDEVPIDNTVGLSFKKVGLASGPGHRIFGEPFFTQYDPRDEDDESILLFQIDSDSTSDTEISFGDSGVMNFFITKEELDELDFSNVIANWDCF